MYLYKVLKEAWPTAMFHHKDSINYQLPKNNCVGCQVVVTYNHRFEISFLFSEQHGFRGIVGFWPENAAEIVDRGVYYLPLDRITGDIKHDRQIVRDSLLEKFNKEENIYQLKKGKEMSELTRKQKDFIDRSIQYLFEEICEELNLKTGDIPAPDLIHLDLIIERFIELNTPKSEVEKC